MTKNIWKKILDGGTLSATDLTPEAKKRLYALFEGYGMPKSTCYNRFFDKGFRKWEIMGVSYIRDAFLVKEKSNTDNIPEGEESNRGYGAVLALSSEYDDSKFYEIVTNLKIGKHLCDRMAELGMSSQMTVRTRFKSNDWKPWELKGVKAIIDEFLCKNRALLYEYKYLSIIQSKKLTT